MQFPDAGTFASGTTQATPADSALPLPAPTSLPPRPRTIAEPQDKGRPAQSQPTAVAPPKLLFLEDDINIQESVGDYLSERGFDVHVVSTVAEARQSIADELYDCLIFDMELPDGTGLEVAQSAGSTMNHRTPVLAVSAYHDLLSAPGTEIFSAALKKPVPVEDLIGALGRLIGRQPEQQPTAVG
jgi:CheY-like chemotaxis protein